MEFIPKYCLPQVPAVPHSQFGCSL